MEESNFAEEKVNLKTLQSNFVERLKNIPAFFIQARLSSTRFNKKIITPIYQGNSILDLLLERIRFNFPSHKVYVLTTNNPADDLLIKHLESKAVSIFRGSEDNVLDRFIAAAEEFKESELIRICSDNPFLLPEFLFELLQDYGGADYISFSYKGIPAMKCHFGFFAERVTLEALKKAASLTNDPLYLEHVTNYLYGNPKIFKVKFIDKTRSLNNLEQYRLTVDTQEDFQTAAYVLERINNPNIMTLKEIIEVVENNPQLRQKMKSEKTKNSK